MNKIISLALAALLLAAPACALADIVGRSGEEYIHRYAAPNGQEIFFVAMEPEPPVQLADVNFDGMEDIVARTSLGASNAYSAFFVLTDGQYAPVYHPGVDGLCNYSLYPELGLVLTQANNGYAGALHDMCLMRWDGGNLALLRRAVGEQVTAWSFSEGVSTQKIYTNQIRLRVWDYTNDPVEGVVIWEETCSLDDLSLSGWEGSALQREDAALWQGVAPQGGD